MPMPISRSVIRCAARKARLAGLSGLFALTMAACVPSQPGVSQQPVERQESACPRGNAQIQCIKDAQKRCQNPRVLVADTNPAVNLTEFSEIYPDRPISEETIRQRPALIVCEGSKR
jgi:hypothetical protein